MAEVIGAPQVAALANHHVQTAGGQRRKLLQRLRDERQVGVELRGALHRPDPGQSGLRQDAADRAAVHAQLAGDGPDPPSLDVVVAQDMRFEFRGYAHRQFLFDRLDRRCEQLDGAWGRFGQTAHTDGGRNGIATSPAPSQASPMTLAPRSSSSRPVDHRPAARVKPDASLPPVGHGNDGCVRRV